eukprot:maker-scaffold_1-snap-gene-29.44-mRNA-1 protein AED:0.01 eAED:0.01 QI:17/0.5/0.66/1/1/1/3/112/242
MTLPGVFRMKRNVADFQTPKKNLLKTRIQERASGHSPSEYTETTRQECREFGLDTEPTFSEAFADLKGENTPAEKNQGSTKTPNSTHLTQKLSARFINSVPNPIAQKIRPRSVEQNSPDLGGNFFTPSRKPSKTKSLLQNSSQIKTIDATKFRVEILTPPSSFVKKVYDSDFSENSLSEDEEYRDRRNRKRRKLNQSGISGLNGSWLEDSFKTPVVSRKRHYTPSPVIAQLFQDEDSRNIIE